MFATFAASVISAIQAVCRSLAGRAIVASDGPLAMCLQKCARVSLAGGGRLELISAVLLLHPVSGQPRTNM